MVRSQKQKFLGAATLVSLHVVGLTACGTAEPIAAYSGFENPEVPTSYSGEVRPGSNRQSNNAENPSEDLPSADPLPDAPSTAGGGFGVNKDMTCDAYVKRNWQVGSYLHEEAKVGSIITATVVGKNTVTAVDGSLVTMENLVSSPMGDERNSFTVDVCVEDFRAALPTTIKDCLPQNLGTEKVTVGGRTYTAQKFKFQNCVSDKNETFGSVIWRVNELPQLGVIKREVTGTFLPSSVGGKLSSSTIKWK